MQSLHEKAEPPRRVLNAAAMVRQAESVFAKMSGGAAGWSFATSHQVASLDAVPDPRCHQRDGDGVAVVLGEIHVQPLVLALVEVVVVFISMMPPAVKRPG